LVNIKDVAILARVSKSTVSNIINNSTNVSIDKIQRVQKAIEELGYKPNATARSLKTKVSNNIAVILPNIEDPNFAFLFTGIERVLSENGYTISLYTTSEIPAKESNIIEQIQQNRVAGAIIITCQPENIYVFEQLEKSDIKLVFVEREVKGKDFNFIEYNNYSSIYKVTSKLLKRGFKNIILITGPKEYSSEIQCINGFTDAISILSKNNNTLIKETNFDKESSFKIAMKTFREGLVPEAVIVTSTQILEGVLKAIYILKNNIIKKQVIISLTEYSWSNDCRLTLEDGPHIIKIQRRSIELGEKAAEKLIENLKYPVLHDIINLQIDNVMLENELGLENKTSPVKIQTSNNIKVLMLESSALDATKILLPDFEQQKGVNILIDTYSIVDLYGKVVSESQKDTYDVFQIDVPWFSEFVESNFLAELDNFIKAYPKTIEGFISGVLDIYSKCKNKYYALPYMFGTQLLFYRKDLFEDPNIKIQFKKVYQSELKPPKTWKEYNIIAKFFTKSFNPDSPVEYGTTLGARFPTSALCEFLPRMWFYGGKIIDISGNLFLEEKAAVKGLKNYIESFNYSSTNSINNHWDEEVEEFCKGKAAMMILFVAHVTEITDRSKSDVVGQIGYEIIPGGIPVLGGWSLGINKNSNNKEISFDFIKWITSKELAIPHTILGGFTPRLDLFKSSDLLTIYPWLPKALESFTLSRERLVSKVTTGGKISERDFENIYGEAIIKAIRKEFSPEKAIKEAQSKIIKLMGKNNFAGFLYKKEGVGIRKI